MKRGMKLYVWEGVLEDYTSGIAFALATSEEEALEQVVAHLGSSLGKNVEESKKWVREHHVKDGMFDGVKATVYDSPVGFTLYGGG